MGYDREGAEAQSGDGSNVERCDDTAEINVGDQDDTAEIDGEVIEAAVEEAAEPKRSLPTPDMPSQSDIDRHREDHIPYQSWCDHCVEGRGREASHRAVDKSKRRISTVSLIIYQ